MKRSNTTTACRARLSLVRALAGAGAGFLAAVLWFDLMFDVQVRGHDGAELPQQVLSSIAAYYAWVTTTSRPMSRLVLLAMLVTIGALIATLLGDDLANWRAAIALVLTLVAVTLAGARTVPAAVRLGSGRDDAATQSRLARQHPPRSPHLHRRDRTHPAVPAAPGVSRWRPDRDANGHCPHRLGRLRP